MSKQTIGIGTTANDGTGDPLRTAFDKTNDNFTELYDAKLKVTTWNGVSFPTATEPTVYILTADHGVPGDADYIQAGAWAIALTAGLTTYSSLYIKP